MSDAKPGTTETIAAAFAGTAFAAGALLVRERTPVPAGVFDGVAVLFLLWGLSLLVHRVWGAASGILARGIGLAAGSLLLASALRPPFDRAALPLATWTLGASLLQASTRTRPWRIALASAGVALLAAGGAIAWTTADAWPESVRLRGALIVGALLGIAGLVTRLVIARRWRTLTPSPVGVLIVAALTATYVAYRAIVATRVANLPLYEWSLGVGAASLMLGRLRRSARDAAVEEGWTGEARRHVQDATPIYDPRMMSLAAPLQRYLETGQGFEDYRTAMLRLAPTGPPPFRKTLEGARPVQGRGRQAKAARRERLATHDALMELLHGHPEPPLRTHP